ncbi:PepSY-associated TM helix domain-containing protein [Paraburkholderia saeva]|uniref:PepSY-associated TM helix domain-containing protein n=1 Tax=Paraburkholderia saeva TaxID=2777537 RepID=UPI001D5347E4|nr:PepSY domain-containing protein [Paraburkholderia saeva]CAG4914434.1 hypothetical protein R52603_04238 [Paraburkholderia saeva]CAG4917965.1 hypothetical protein R70241_04596 [Paraburkholderia saeva]
MTSTSSPRSAATDTYRLLWRWHFYAGLFVMPFLSVLAITGTVYCFQPQIEPLLYPGLLKVQDRGHDRMSWQSLLLRAQQAAPKGATVTTASINTDRTKSAEFVVRLPEAGSESMYLDPYDGTVLGTLSVEGRFMQQIRMVHRKLLIGKTGELLMELAACWTLVMIGTGVALWWPHRQGTRGAILMPRRAASGRTWWKELHAATGIWFALGALAFVLTGLPWSGFWGRQFKILTTEAHIGSPAGVWGDPKVQSKPRASAGSDDAAASHAHHAQPAAPGDDSMPGMVMDDLPLRQTPWAVGEMRVPQQPGGEPAPGTAAIDIDYVVAIAATHGVRSGYQIVLPKSPAGVFTVSSFPADPKAERTLHIDQYSGGVLKDIGYDDYGVAGKAVSYGTSLHMGRYFGLANQIVCAVISMSLATLAGTGFWMWWRRRPDGALRAPPQPAFEPPMRAWVVGLGIAGALFPLLGVTLILVWFVDRRVMRKPVIGANSA